MDVASYNSNYLFEILMRVDPADIFKCILISKDWLEVITGEYFRTKYLKKWKGKLVMGLMMFSTALRNTELILPTTVLGLQLNDKTLTPERSRIGSFVSKSPNSSHMLFISTALSRKTLYVWSSGLTIGPPLPPPPVNYNNLMVNVLSDDGAADSYKVILADAELGIEKKTISIQTFSSSTSHWEQSTLSCSNSFQLDRCHGASSGVVTKCGGVIYWEARSRGLPCLAAWDMKAGSSVRLILEPEVPSLLRTPFYEGKEICREEIPPLNDFRTYHGGSPKGSLMSATCTVYNAFQNNCDYGSWMIKIFDFDETMKDWKLLHEVRHGDILTENLALLSYLFGKGVGAIPPNGFVFVSFLPGRVDSMLVGMEQHLFDYNLESRKLKHVDYLKYVYCDPDGRKFKANVAYHPLTLQDLGVWLSSPPSISLEG